MTIEIEGIPGWCAGTKAIGVRRPPSDEDYNQLIRSAVNYDNASCVVISTNSKERELNKWLKSKGFKKGPAIRNHAHKSHLTALYFKQITKAEFSRFGGGSNE